jgi:hypothetical protein
VANDGHGEFFFFLADVTMVYLVVSFGDLLENYVASEGLICSQCTRPHTALSRDLDIFIFDAK